MTSWNGARAYLVAGMVALCGSAHASSIKKPECRDPPPIDPVANVESLPTHEAITDYLMIQDGPARFSCSSATLVYAGTRDAAAIRVVSKYKAGGAIHAETYAPRDEKIGGWRRHGIVRIQARNGAVRALEYYCRGFEVGFHRYFNDEGKLVAVADYTRSDYEWEKRIPSPTLRAFYQGSSKLGTVSPTLQGAHRFREVYRVQGDRAERASFSLGDIFHSNWMAVGTNSTVKDWTEPGMQGSVTLFKQPWQIRNFDFQYQGFAEVYQRKRLGVPGPRTSTEYNSTLLECPWIDEAMEPGLTDPRFKFEPPAILTEAERVDTPEQRLASCLRAPTVSCLLEQALVAARRAQPVHGDQMLNYADDAIVAGQPALARAAMEEVLADTRGYTFPNPLFARQGVIKAQAEAAMGLEDEAKKSADAAFKNAIGQNTHAAGRDVRVLEAIGPRLARIAAIDRARAAVREVPMAYAEDSPFTLEEIAIAQARQGNVSGARETLAELSQIGAQAGAPEAEAILQVAAAQAERGDAPAAAATLDKLAVAAPSGPSQASSVAVRVAAIRARFTPTDTLTAAIEQALEKSDLTARLSVATAYCEAGSTTLGVKVLQRARSTLSRPTAEQIADLGTAEAKCGRPDRARADFTRAREVIGRMSPNYGGDMIYELNPVESALSHLRVRMVDAGLIDALPEGKDAQPGEFAIALAVRRAELGDPGKALSTLDAIRIEEPGRDETRQRQVLARARVLRLLSRNEEAEAEFARARNIALARDTAEMRVVLLIRLADARLRERQQAQARKSLEEARAALIADLARPGVRWTASGPATGTISLARAYAAAGDDVAALNLISPGSRQMKFQAIALRAADRVNGEIAVAQARTGAAVESMASLRRIEAAPWRVWYLSRITPIPEERKDKALQAAVAGFWTAVLDESQSVVASARSAEERRRVYHAYLATLRMSNRPGTDAQRDHVLESLRRSLDLFTNAGERSRAGCELAFTYHHFGQSAAAATQFANAQSVQPPPGMRREAGAPPLPAGACLYWMTSTPMSGQARSEIERIVEARRSWVQSNNGMTRPEQGLQELALILSESEMGEIDWMTGTRFRR